MDSTTFVKNFEIDPEDISLLVPHIGPLLKLLLTEFKNNAGDTMATAYTHKTTSCEALTAYALKDLVRLIADNSKEPQIPRAVRAPQKKTQVNRMHPALRNYNQTKTEVVPNKGPAIRNNEVVDGKELYKLFLCYEAKVWFRVVLAILTSFPSSMDGHSRFSVISEGQKGKLIASYAKYTKYSDQMKLLQAQGTPMKVDAGKVHQERKNLVEEIKKVLSGPHHPCKDAVQDFLHFLKNSTKDLDATCDVLGPMILVPADPNSFGNKVKIFKNRSKKLRDSCSRLLKIMVENQDVIFQSRRVREFEVEFNKFSNLSIEESELGRRNRLKNYLQHFFEIRDPLCVTIVDPLFEYFAFDDIARCIYTKYRMLPFGWKDELERNLNKAGDDPFAQFMPQMKTNEKKPKENYGVVQGSYYDAEVDVATKSARETQHMSVIGGLAHDPNVPFAWFKNLSKTKVKYLTEKTLTWPEALREKFYAPYNSNDPEVEKIIDEFVNKQKDLLLTLKAFHNYYVTEVMAIARGDVGEMAKNTLGIEPHDAKLIFKQNLKEVISAQERFVVALEPLSLMKTAQIKSEYRGIGRAGILFKQFVTCQKTLTQGYQHYNVNYQTKIDRLKTIQDEVERRKPVGNGSPSSMMRSSKNSKLFRQSKSKKKKNLNFIELWEELSATKAALTNKQLGSVLIMPIQAVPRYKIFFDRITKKAGVDYNGKHLGEEASNVAEAISVAVNENIKRSKDVVDKLLGEGSRH